MEVPFSVVSNHGQPKILQGPDVPQDMMILGTVDKYNESWFEEMGVEKSIYRTMDFNQSMCIVISGNKGSGKDYTLHGGMMSQQY